MHAADLRVHCPLYQVDLDVGLLQSEHRGGLELPDTGDRMIMRASAMVSAM